MVQKIHLLIMPLEEWQLYQTSLLLVQSLMGQCLEELCPFESLAFYSTEYPHVADISHDLSKDHNGHCIGSLIYEMNLNQHCGDVRSQQSEHLPAQVMHLEMQNFCRLDCE